MPGHRQREDEGVGVHRAAREQQQPAERDGQDEHVDEEQVEREQPDRPAEVVLVHVLDDRDLELPREKHEREHRQEREERPGPPASARRRGAGELAQPGRCAGEAEDVAEAAVDAKRDERPDGEEGEELHQRLERDRGDEPLVPLGDVEVARAEQDRERGERDRDVERLVLQERRGEHLRRHRDVRVLQQDLEAAGDRLELERDVGDDAEDGDDRDEPAEELTLPVARGDEVGDRRDAVGLADADDLPLHEPPEPHDERGSEVDGQEPDAARRRAPHAPVEGPGAAVDREGEARLGAPVAVRRDGEQHAEVGERDEDDHPTLEHGRGSYSGGRSTTQAMSAMMSTHAAKT